MRIKALVISASLPPFNDSSTLQLVERVHRFPEHGIEAMFIGPDMPNGVETGLLQRLPGNSRILRTPATTYDRVMAFLSRARLGRLLAWVYSNVMYRIAVPDVRAGWDRQAMRLCIQMWSDLRPDVIISHGGSHTAHIAACKLAQKFSLPWIADLGDPWSLVDSDLLTFFLKTKRNRRLEIKTILYASGLVFTTETTLKAYYKWLGDKLPKSIVLPAYGYSPADFPIDTLKRTLQLDNQIVFSYIGTAHRRNRNLIPLIQAMGSLEQSGRARHQFVLNIIGPHSYSFEREAKRQGLRYVHFSERVSYQESVDWINRSHVLVIVGNLSPLQIPAKVYPYLGSGRVILYIGQLPRHQDPTAHLLEKFPGVIFAQNNCKSIESSIKEIDERYENLVQDAIRRLNLTLLQEYKTDVVSDRFAEFVLEILTNRRMG